MERIVEALNKSKSNHFIQESTSNFVTKLDESTSDKINVSFDVLGEKKIKVNVSIEKLNETYADCKVCSELQQYETPVSYSILSEFINGIVLETQEILLTKETD